MAGFLSEVAIANLALSSIGKGKIESLTEQSAEAKEANLWFDHVRRQILRSHDWSFARKRQALSLHGDAPPDDWGYRYQYPSDCLRFLRIINPLGERADAIPWRVLTAVSGEEKTILTNLASAEGEYTFEQLSTPLYTEFFIELFSTALSVPLAQALVKKASIIERQAGKTRSLMRMAPAIDANEQVEEPPRDTDWIRDRE